MTKLADAGIFAAGASEESGEAGSEKTSEKPEQSREQPGRKRNTGGCTDTTKKDGGK